MGSKNSGSDNTRMPRTVGSIANSPHNRQEGEHVSVNPNQPRQPSNLQDLLRFSMEARSQGQSGSQVLPMDEERKKWLDNAMKYMTTDVIQILLQAIDLLKNAGSLSVNDDPKEYEDALETVSGCVENLDVANDFHKIGGFTVFEPCLQSCHPSLQWKAANVIAELTQNNPYCQERAIEMDFLPMLLKLLDQSHNELTRVKALYAISCILRDNPKALHTFSQHDGFSVLLRSMQSHVEKLKTKSSFLLTSLCAQTPEIIDSLCSMGFVEQLAALVVQQQQPGFCPAGSNGGRSLEHLLSALLTLVRGHEGAQSACRRPELGLRGSLEYHLQSVSGKDEFREEADYCHELLKVVFSGDPEEEER